MKRNKDEDVQITPEEKEMLRRLMETPGIEKDWDFFQDLNMDVPPPEFFMRGRPERHIGLRRIGRKALKAGGFVACVLICAMIIAPFMVPDTANADKTPFQILAENIRNGFLEVRPAGEDMEEIASEMTIYKEDKIEARGKKIFPELKIPSYVPEKYSFEYLKIIKDENGYSTATYIYEDQNDDQLKIVQRILSDDVENAFNNYIEAPEGVVGDELKFQYDDISGRNMLTVWPDARTRFIISATLEDQELETIYYSLK